MSKKPATEKADWWAIGSNIQICMYIDVAMYVHMYVYLMSTKLNDTTFAKSATMSSHAQLWYNHVKWLAYWMFCCFTNNRYVLVIPQNEYGILVITRDWGEAEC